MSEVELALFSPEAAGAVLLKQRPPPQLVRYEAAAREKEVVKMIIKVAAQNCTRFMPEHKAESYIGQVIYLPDGLLPMGTPGVLTVDKHGEPIGIDEVCFADSSKKFSDGVKVAPLVWADPETGSPLQSE